MPEVLASSAYTNPNDARKTAFQRAHSTTLPAFAWALEHPRLFNDFNLWMAAQREGQQSWLDVFPYERLTQNQTGDATALFVDIGGGLGHQCVALSRRMPQNSGRIVLQDLAPAVSQAIPCEGVEHMVYDFWTEQPIKGAAFYYMRNVLHDYSDDQVVTLLHIQKAALANESVILIDEMVIPDVGPHWQAAEMDVALMASLAAMERTQRQWETLIGLAGLSIKEWHTYVPETSNCVMVIG